MKKIIPLSVLFTCLLNKNVTAQYWSPLATGIGIPFGMGVVYTVASYNGELYAGGYFTSASGVSANYITRWDGASWLPAGTGMNGPVRGLVVYNGMLYASGEFSTAGGVPANRIAKWDGTNWSAVGSVYVGQGEITMAVFNNELYVAGYFPDIGGQEALVAKWDGTNWSVIGTMDLAINKFYSMAIHNGALYIAGDSNWAGGTPVHHDIVKWDGSGWSALNALPNGPIYTLCSYNGDLYAAGYFTHAGGVAANQIAKWNNSTWSAVGSGINLTNNEIFHSSVQTSTVYNGALYAGGYFDSAGTVFTKNIAKWDGASWSGLGQGADYWVSAFTSVDSALYVGGWFNLVNGAIPSHKIARWSENCVNPPPPQPVIIMGNNLVCESSSQNYFVDPVPGATRYAWKLPDGWTGSSSTQNITVIVGSLDGNISVTAINDCGNSQPRSTSLSVKQQVDQPASITGDTNPCIGRMENYIVDPVPYASNYIWTLPSGWTGTSTTNSIIATVGNLPGTLSVAAANDCGIGPARFLNVSPKPIPSKPDSITGPQSACLGTLQTYSVNPVAGATGYMWTLPSGWTGNSTTNILTTTLGSLPGIISVASVNCSGNSEAMNLPVAIELVPGPPASIQGNLFVMTDDTVSYSTPGIGEFLWSLNGGGQISSGQSSNLVTIIWNTPGIYRLSVRKLNNCGQSAETVIEINVIKGTNSHELKLIPNPTSGQFWLFVKSKENKTVRFEIFDLAGRQISSSSAWSGDNDYFIPVSLDKAANGIYLVKVFIDNKAYLQKLVKAN